MIIKSCNKNHQYIGIYISFVYRIIYTSLIYKSQIVNCAPVQLAARNEDDQQGRQTYLNLISFIV